jgi:putative oxidoreductase
MKLLISIYSEFIAILNKLSPVMILVLRLWIAHIFFAAGLVKIEDFSTTIALFRDEYKTPFLPPEVAAFLGTFFELSCPILLTLGLATRLATLPLLAMTAVIQFTYDQNIQHIYWAMLLGTILVSGAGKISLDYLISKKFNQPRKENL